MHFLKLLPFISVTNFLQYLKPKALRMTLDQSYELLFLSTLAKQIFHENNPFFGQIAEYITSCLLIMQQKGVCKKNHDYQLPMAAYTLHDFALSTIILSLIFGKVTEILCIKISHKGENIPIFCCRIMQFAMIQKSLIKQQGIK